MKNYNIFYKKDAFDNLFQQDAHEFLNYLLNTCADILKAEMKELKELKRIEEQNRLTESLTRLNTKSYKSLHKPLATSSNNNNSSSNHVNHSNGASIVNNNKNSSNQSTGINNNHNSQIYKTNQLNGSNSKNGSSKSLSSDNSLNSGSKNSNYSPNESDDLNKINL